MNRRERRELLELRTGVEVDLFRSRIATVWHRLNAISGTFDWSVYLIFGGRTIEEQWKIWAKGRKKVRNKWIRTGRVVTRARPWQTPHVFGLAADFALIGPYGKKGKQAWLPDRHKHWQLIGDEADRVGLRWGGNFKKLKDLGHIEHPEWKELTEGEREMLRAKA